MYFGGFGFGGCNPALLGFLGFRDFIESRSFNLGKCNYTGSCTSEKSDYTFIGFLELILTGLVELSVLISEVVKSSRLSSLSKISKYRQIASVAKFLAGISGFQGLSWLSILSIFLSGDCIAFETSDSSYISIFIFNYYVLTIAFTSRLSDTLMLGWGSKSIF